MEFYKPFTIPTKYGKQKDGFIYEDFYKLLAPIDTKCQFEGMKLLEVDGLTDLSTEGISLVDFENKKQIKIDSSLYYPQGIKIGAGL